MPSSSLRHLTSQDATRLLGLIDRFDRHTVAVVGDLLADEFIYGRVARVSREAPVLILEYDKSQVVPGGAGNAANNVAALGGATRAAGVVGDDESGTKLVEALPENVDRRFILRARGGHTPTKTRILAGGIHSAKQQVVRIDRHPRARVDDQTRAAFQRKALSAIKGCDGILVSDYGAGLITPALVAEIKRTAAARRQTPVPILVDSRYDLHRYRGLTACTPNESEVESLLGVHIDDNARVLEKSGRALLARTGMDIVLVTRGSRGMALFERDRPTHHLAIFGSDEIADVTGAGDTVIATMTLALAAGGTALEAARLANYAGGLVVMKRGTATVSGAELRQAVLSDVREGGRR